MERQKQAKTILPTSDEGFSISFTPENTAAPTLVPNPQTLSLPNSSLISGTPSSHPFLSAVGLTLEGVVSSIQGQDMTHTGHFNQFIDMQNDNLSALQGTKNSTLGTKPNPNPNNPHLVPNTKNYNFNGVNNQPGPYPALFNPNPVHARSGIEIGNPIDKFVTLQRPTLFPSHVPWNSRPENHQFSNSDFYGARYATNYAQSPQPFNTMQNQQVGHASGMQQIFDLQSQNSMRLEPYSNLEPVVATVPPNPVPQVYRPVLVDPAAPSASTIATTRNSFGPRSSMPPIYHPLYENQDHRHHPQLMMPNGLGQHSGASLQHWSQGLLNQKSECNQRMNTHNLQRESNTSSLAHQSRILGHSSTRTIEGTSSQVFNTREAEIAPISRTQPSEAIRRILDMNPTRIVTHNNMQIGRKRYEPPRRGRPRKQCDNAEISSSQSGRKPYEPPRRGRPRKQLDDAKESFSQRGKSRKVSSKAQKAETTYASQQIPQQTPDSVVNTDQNAILTNTVYDMEFETKGIPPPPPEN